jgi:hypothetical protein
MNKIYVLMTWILLAASLAAAQTTFTRTYTFPGTINLACCSSFSYGFTSVKQDTTLNSLGMVKVTSIAVSAVGSINSPDLLGDAGLDWEVFIGPRPFGLPTGEMSGTSVNPGTYSSSAPTQLRFTEIIPLSSGSYKFAGSFTFDDGTLTTDTPIDNLKYDANGPMDVSNGLNVQAFLWSGAQGADIDFSSITITITGTTTCNLGLPQSLIPYVDNPTTMRARFNPAAGGGSTSLTAAELACGYSEFNWQQEILYLPGPGGPTAVSNPNVPLHTVPTRTAPSPFLDPPKGGYTYFFTQTGNWVSFFINPDAYPFYYNSYGVSAKTVSDPVLGDLLNFDDTPKNPQFVAVAKAGILDPLVSFETRLVGVGTDGTYDILGKFTWFSTYTGAKGGVTPETASFPDDGSGIGGVTITSINGTPTVTMFSAFSSKAQSSTSSFELKSQFTLGSGSTGINPLTHDVVLSLGPYSVTIPSHLFQLTSKGDYVYEGTIKGVSLQTRIVPSTTAPNSYTLTLEGNTPVDLSYPLVELTIGSNIGVGAAQVD